MYKIITDIQILQQINEAAKLKEGNENVQYCELLKHPIRNEYAIPIMEGILRGYNLSFIDELLTGNVESLPADWSWPFENESIRITIPNNLILKEAYLRALIQYCDANEVKYIVQGDLSCIYVNYILPEHQIILDLYKEIIIETL
jgi:hypothetical protein